ncbi:hypothetical protein [Streptomyces sp. NPDC051567]|uniref:hypothetical protein n=1 Tax=Streptomyces sp. NPDC051567 TaxID=3365660 RepID=UPI0037926F7F
MTAAPRSAGSVAGGLFYGARSYGGTTYHRCLRLLVVLAVLLATLPTAGLVLRAGLPAVWALVLLGVLLVLSGLPIAPAGGSDRAKLLRGCVPRRQIAYVKAGRAEHVQGLEQLARHLGAVLVRTGREAPTVPEPAGRAHGRSGPAGTGDGGSVLRASTAAGSSGRSRSRRRRT